eukprot:CAMPEP_0119373214 /NCGR_PEP_ID=MMETSP1334-20130426/23882_1 /TAXON_ID=127549 /ORGANISM="Calcidiscus leptoporus, Strain RCC1130" /LENGTH=284 /DNA_ID=CAMNT_0007390909 /DNA_START=126 /DNA_END=980 /DNA_ORIENTATION=-
MWRSALLKPFKLWTVCLHEFSHAIAAWATCNKVTGIEINAMEGGLTHWSGRQDRMRCSQHAVLPAGYLGSTLWGALTILSCSSVAWAEAMGCILLSVLGICALYAAFGKTEQERTPLLAVCTGFGLALGLATFLAIGSSGNGWDLVLYALLLFLGTLNVVFGIIDIFDDTLKRTDARSDAYRFAQLHQIFRPKCVGLVWFLLAVAAFLVTFFLYLTIKQHSDRPELGWWAFLPGPVVLGMATVYNGLTSSDCLRLRKKIATANNTPSHPHKPNNGPEQMVAGQL